MFIDEVFSESSNSVVYRISFSENSIVLLSPLSPDTISEWITVTIEGYESPADFTYKFAYNGIGTIDVTFTFNKDVSNSDINVSF